MKKLYYKKNINATAEKVYTTMLGLENITTFEQWTAEFNPTSTYQGSWEKGSKIYFIGTYENGTIGGLVSEIIENIPSQFVSIFHKGIYDGENEINEGPEVEKCAGGLENYLFDEKDGVTTVTIEMDVAEDNVDYFNDTWPKALNKLKEIIENR